MIITTVLSVKVLSALLLGGVGGFFFKKHKDKRSTKTSKPEVN